MKNYPSQKISKLKSQLINGIDITIQFNDHLEKNIQKDLIYQKFQNFRV